MTVQTVRPEDAADWERMRQALWPEPEGAHAEEIVRFFAGERPMSEETLIARDEAGRAVGIAELSIRPYAEGCYSGRVAYLEGWFVEPASRGTGVGRALVEAAEAWGRARGCTELGSDTEIDNLGSAAAHGALGFEEVERIVCFRKSL
jgi:aminoglycoside 6'-N-acetyltransferase I